MFTRNRKLSSFSYDYNKGIAKMSANIFQPLQEPYKKLFNSAKTNNIPKMFPLEHLNSPHYEIQILTEDPTNKKEWDKYAQFFSKPVQKPIPVVRVDYDSVKNLSRNHQMPYHYLQTENIDQILKSLHGRDHIVVLNPRNCNQRPINYRLKPLNKLNHDDIDYLVDSILNFIDKDDKTGNAKRKCPCSQNFGILHNYNPPKKGHCRCQRRNRRNCDESYLFYLSNEKDSWQDLLLRMLPVGRKWLQMGKI